MYCHHHTVFHYRILLVTEAVFHYRILLVTEALMLNGLTFSNYLESKKNGTCLNFFHVNLLLNSIFISAFSVINKK